ncbi:MAG: hypothetical protein ISR73_06660 [Gammaproteobacteria bacterium]|nr:hypothetical protein [Gammaproteobacteria bacterium]
MPLPSVCWIPDRVRHDDVEKSRVLDLSLVIPAHDCRDAEGRAKQDARAEAGIQSTRSPGHCPCHPFIGYRIESGMTTLIKAEYSTYLSSYQRMLVSSPLEAQVIAPAIRFLDAGSSPARRPGE